MKESKLFRVVQCPRCGEIQTTYTDANKSMKCRYCGRASPMRRKAMWAVKVFHTDSSAYVTGEVCRRIRIQEGLALEER